VAHLAAALRIEDRAVELDAALVDGDDPRPGGLQIGIVAEKELGAHAKQAEECGSRASSTLENLREKRAGPIDLRMIEQLGRRTRFDDDAAVGEIHGVGE